METGVLAEYPFCLAAHEPVGVHGAVPQDAVPGAVALADGLHPPVPVGRHERTEDDLHAPDVTDDKLLLTRIREAAWRIGGGLAALPLQVISLFLVYHGAGEAVGDLYRRLIPGTKGRARQGFALVGCLLLGLPVAIAMSATGLVLVVALGRMAYRPFWAASAGPAELRHAWGGPNPVLATIVYWLVGAVVVVAADLVLRGGRYLQRVLIFRRPGPEPRSSGRAGPRSTARRP